MGHHYLLGAYSHVVLAALHRGADMMNGNGVGYLVATAASVVVSRLFSWRVGQTGIILKLRRVDDRGEASSSLVAVFDDSGVVTVMLLC